MNSDEIADIARVPLYNDALYDEVRKKAIGYLKPSC